MAFEFVLPVSDLQEVIVVRQAVNNALREYAEKNNLKSAATDEMALLVTDVWYDARVPELHIDIAHITNQETAAYIRDLRKLNQPV
jgi:dihydroorotase